MRAFHVIGLIWVLIGRAAVRRDPRHIANVFCKAGWLKAGTNHVRQSWP